MASVRRVGLSTAFKVDLAQADLAQPRIDRGNMPRFSVVARTSKRELGIGQSKHIGGASLDQRYRLDRLQRRTSQDTPLSVSPNMPDAIRVNNNHVDLMAALHHRSSNNIHDQHHERSLPEGGR